MVAAESDIQDEQGLGVQRVGMRSNQEERSAWPWAGGGGCTGSWRANRESSWARADSPAWNCFPVMVSVRPAVWPWHQVCHIRTYLQRIVIAWLLP